MSALVRLEIGDLIALLFETAAGIQRRGMLDGSGDHVLAASSAVRSAENGGVDRLGTARGEGDLGRVSTHQRRDAAAGVLQNAGGLDAHFMNARRIAELLCHDAAGGFGGLGQHEGCRGMIQIMHNVLLKKRGKAIKF